MDAFSEYITLSEVNESDTHGDRTQDRMFVVYNKIGHSSRSSSIQRSKTKKKRKKEKKTKEKSQIEKKDK